MHDETAAFNQVLRAIKASHADDARGIWRAITQDAELKGGLITASQTEDSDVTDAEAAAFWRGAAEAPAGVAPPVATNTQGADDGDEFDEME